MSAAARVPRLSIRSVARHGKCPVYARYSSSVSKSIASTRPDSTTPLTSILISNRGEIALRIQRTAAEYGIRATTIYTDPDARSQHALSSPFSVNIGEPSAYLDGDKIIDVARRQGCEAVHPGYGFLSENAAFARKCSEAGIKFIGPPWQAIEAMGSKSRSKEIMTAAGVACIPGYHGANQDAQHLQAEAAKIGYPVLLKAVKGGGGKGMRIVATASEFAEQLRSAMSEARNSFGDDVMLVEKYIQTPRHIEVQVFADTHGNCVALGERDCSVQRRHQKILEESPAPGLAADVREHIWATARAAALAVGYHGAGTVEFIFDTANGDFFFMEMNTRLQVEHPVTEMVTGEDLVKWQFMVAEGAPLPLSQEQVRQRIAERGWAIEARIYAENPDRNFMPDSGPLLHLRTPACTPTVRVDAGLAAGDEISSHYDPMIGKLIVHGATRREALQKLRLALEQYEIAGPASNIEFLKRLCVSPAFVRGDVDTGYIGTHAAELFATAPVEPEAFAQAALGALLSDPAAPAPALSPHSTNIGFPDGTNIGFPNSFQTRTVHIAATRPDGRADGPVTAVLVRQTGPSLYDIRVGDQHHYAGVSASLSARDRSLTSYYPHARIDSTVVQQGSALTLFQLGRQYRLQLAPPAWAAKARGATPALNSVVAPMPCKVLRVDIAAGDAVKKDQILVVIESMKMETVIRSPLDGVISRVIHNAGDICKAGTALVEFQK